MDVRIKTRLPPLETGRDQFRWSGLCLPPRPTREFQLARDKADLRQTLRKTCPATAGIYGFLDRTGSLIYVGYSARLRNRLLTYFQQSRSPRKEQRISNVAETLMWEEVGHPFVAMHRELEVIQRSQPRLNVRGRSRRQRMGYLLQTAEDAPRFALRQHVSPGVRHWWGPLWINRSLRVAVKNLNRALLLPDCPSSTRMAFSDDRWLFSQEPNTPCLRAQTGSCLAPCDGQCSRARYFNQLQFAREFLDGKSNELLTALEARLTAAATERRFEYAARCRDVWQSLANLQSRLQSAREPCLQHGVYPIRLRRRKVWFLMAGGIVQGSLAEPFSRRRTQEFLNLIDRHTAGHLDQPVQHNRLAAQIVVRWFHQHPEQLDKVIPLNAARELLPSSSQHRSKPMQSSA